MVNSHIEWSFENKGSLLLPLRAYFKDDENEEILQKLL